jgi:hypothetical protein
MGASLLGIVAVVENEHALGEEEGEESDPGEQADLSRVAEVLERLREHVEERDGDDDAARERHQRGEGVCEPQA